MKKRKSIPGTIDQYLRWPIWLSLLWIPILISLSFIDWKAFFVLLFFAVVYVCFVLYLYQSRKSKLMSSLLEFSLKANDNNARLFEEMPTAYCIVNEEGGILWENKAFHHILQKDSGVKKNLLSLFPNIQKEILTESGAVLEVHSSFKDRKYCIDLIRVDSLQDAEPESVTLSEETRLIAVYLRDETEELELQQKLDEERIVLGLAYVDNYEEVMEQIEEVRRSLLTALVDRKINRYIGSANGVVKKIEKDKYFFILKQSALEKMMDDRFSILEEV